MPAGTRYFTYNGLGLRVGRVDSTGTYVYICDGTAPGSPVLSDAHAVYTPGLSERRGSVSVFPDNDRLGNLWMMDAVNGTSTVAGELFSGFGVTMFTSGSSATPFQYGGGNGCLTDSDSGLVLMGYRYYDSRTGRFISQDPAGDGDNWYAYCGNSPTNGGDPSGLTMIYDPSKANAQYTGPSNWPDYHNGVDGVYDFFKSDGHGGYVYWGTDAIGPGSLIDAINNIPMSSGTGSPSTGGMIAGGQLQPGPDGSKFRYDMGEQPKPDMHIYHNGDPKGPETNIDHKGRLRVGEHRGRILKEIPKKMRNAYRPIIRTFLERAGMAGEAIGEALDGLTLDIPIIGYYDPRLIYQNQNGSTNVHNQE